MLDLHFSAFVADPFAALRRLYDFAELDWNADAEQRMQAWWKTHPADEHGRHAHRFSDTGLDEGEEREKVKGYVEYFGVREERVA